MQKKEFLGKNQRLLVFTSEEAIFASSIEFNHRWSKEAKNFLGRQRFSKVAWRWLIPAISLNQTIFTLSPSFWTLQRTLPRSLVQQISVNSIWLAHLPVGSNNRVDQLSKRRQISRVPIKENGDSVMLDVKHKVIRSIQLFQFAGDTYTYKIADVVSCNHPYSPIWNEIQVSSFRI